MSNAVHAVCAEDPLYSAIEPERTRRMDAGPHHLRGSGNPSL
jgi:hypothetical protein